MFKFLKKENKKFENLEQVSEYLNKLNKKVDKLSENLDNLKEQSKDCFQKIGIIRFNPFNDVGGDQSFCIALLDAHNNGFVLTSHFSREMNRAYTKVIKNGESEHSLSKEEKEAIQKAINKES